MPGPWRWLKRRRIHGSHDAQFASAVVHFTLTAEVSRRLDLARGTRRLLNAELAVSAAWPSEDKIRVTKRLRPLARSMRRTRAMYEEYARASAEKGWTAGVRFAIRYPKVGVLHLRSLWAPRVIADLNVLITKQTILSLIIFVLKHPIVGLRKVLPNVRFTSNSNSEDEDSQSTAPNLTEGALEGSAEVYEDDDDPMDTLDEAERLVMDQQIISAMERQSDSRLFGGVNHDEDRFVRLQLRNSYHDFVLPDSDDVQHIVFEPRLLMHESGVVQLNLRLSTKGPLTADQIISLMWGPEPRLTYSSMSTPLLTGSEWE